MGDEGRSLFDFEGIGDRVLGGSLFGVEGIGDQIL
jgi:hypothetical protein